MSIAQSGKRSDQERQALEIAEEAREEHWLQPSFAAELFSGNFKFNLIYPFPEQDLKDQKIGDAYIEQIMNFLLQNHDPLEVDRTSTVSQKVMRGLAELKAFGLKIPQEYGGLGFSQTNYNRVIHAVGSYCSSLGVLLSAHQSIGVPQPLMMFGTPEQKKRWLPRLASGEISAFALTEMEVGSDPAQMKTTATPIENGKFFSINGQKLWTTNGPIAKLLVVMAVTPPKILPNGKEKKQITAFVVETNTPGFSVLHRCDFMGLKGIQNGLLNFDNVRVPRENILWDEGRGLKLALMTLNIGRLTLPAAMAACGKVLYATAKTWGAERKQWGRPIGQHEAPASEIVRSAIGTYALDAVSKLSSGLADKKASDIRIEASVAKLFSAGVVWRIVDHVLQLRGGRGYETADSLRARGEDAYPIEKMMRDMRINMIIEGTSHIQRLFVSREALDRHLRIAGSLFNPHVSAGDKIKTCIKAFFFYAYWYPKQWLTFLFWTCLGWAPSWEGRRLQFIRRMSPRLALKIFHAMVLNGPGLEKKQLTLGKIVDTGTSLFVMAAVLSRYLTRKKNGNLHLKEKDIVKELCAQLKAAALSSYYRIHVWPGKSKVIGLSQDMMDGKLDWLIDDVCDIVSLSKDRQGKLPLHAEPVVKKAI